jgi:hypothetical protein
MGTLGLLGALEVAVAALEMAVLAAVWLTWRWKVNVPVWPGGTGLEKDYIVKDWHCRSLKKRNLDNDISAQGKTSGEDPQKTG